MNIKVVNQSKFKLPKYETAGSAGMDLKANLEQPITIDSLERTLVPTGLFIELPKGYEAQIRARSGLSIKKGITLINAIGTIDSDYRGEIKVPVVNLSKEPFTITDGERIAQMVIAKHEVAEWQLVDKLEFSDRGDGGFGSTGAK